MAEVLFACTGSCGSEVSEDEYGAGKTTCAAENCERQGQPLSRKMYCPTCDVRFEENAEHLCD